MDKIKQICMMVVFAIVGIVIVVNVAPTLFSVTYDYVDRDNENAGWIRFADTKGGAEVSYTIGQEITVATATSVQSGSGDTILWADDNLTVFVKDGMARYVGKNGSVVAGALGNEFSIFRNNLRTVITDGEDTYTFSSPRKAMVPNPEGAYASFLNGQESILKTPYQHYVGGVMGFYAYDRMNTTEETLVLDVNKEDDTLYGASWVIQ